MNKTLKFLLLPTLGLLVAVIVLLKVNIKAQTIVTRQLLVEEAHEFDLSPDGEYIAFCNREGLKRLSLKSGKQEWLLRFPPQLKNCPVRHIKWSPDMTRIAFIRGFLPQHNELMVLELVTKRLRVIDRALGFLGIAWSPDSRQLAWIKGEKGKAKAGSQYRLMIGVLERDKVHFKVIREGGLGIYSIRWTADGQFLVSGGPSALGVMRSDGTNLKWLRPSGRFPMHGYFSIPYSGWDVSPDGTTVAFGFGDSLWLYSVKKPEAPPVKIRLAARAIEICWSPDGNGLLYVVSESKAPVAPGSAQTGPPHSLYWIDKKGRENQFILREEKGICNLQWLKGRDVFYISGGVLWKVTLRL